MAEMVRARGWWRIRPQLLVWVFTLGLGTGTLLLWAAVLRHGAPVPTPLRVPWPVLAAGFAAGHFAGIRIEAR